MTTLFAILAIVAYAGICWAMFSGAEAGYSALKDADVAPERRPLWLFGVCAAALQCVGLTLSGLVNFYASLSWVSALMAMLASATLLRTGERFLPLLSFVIAMLAISLHLLVAGAVKQLEGWQIQLHASVALLAYAALSLAGAQALLLLVVERRLRSPQRSGVRQNPWHQFWRKFGAWLPPLSRLERQLFQLIGVGFLLLTLTLLSGGLFISNWFAQHLVHKTVLTIAAWLVFGTLLLGNWRFGWRGRQAAIATLLGMLLLALAFFGSKFALEVVLKRGFG